MVGEAERETSETGAECGEGRREGGFRKREDETRFRARGDSAF